MDPKKIIETVNQISQVDLLDTTVILGVLFVVALALNCAIAYQCCKARARKARVDIDPDGQPAGDGAVDGQPAGDGAVDGQPVGDGAVDGQPVGDGAVDGQPAGDGEVGNGVLEIASPFEAGIFEYDSFALLPEIFPVNATILLLVHGVLFSTFKQYDYLLLVCNVGWLGSPSVMCLGRHVLGCGG